MKISFNSKFGKVSAILKDHGKDNLVILTHGLTSDKESRTIVALADRVARQGISVLAVDLYAHGESEGAMRELTVSKAAESIISAYGYAKSLGFRNIQLSGSSFSGEVCLVAAAYLNPVAIALKCPVFDYAELLLTRLGEGGVKKWKESDEMEMYKVKFGYGIYQDAVKLNIEELAKKVTCPALFVHGSGDKMVPPSHSENAFTSIGSKDKKLHIVKGADHFFIHEKHFHEMLDAVDDWIVRHKR